MLNIVINLHFPKSEQKQTLLRSILLESLISLQLQNNTKFSFFFSAELFWKTTKLGGQTLLLKFHLINNKFFFVFLRKKPFENVSLPKIWIKLFFEKSHMIKLSIKIESEKRRKQLNISSSSSINSQRVCHSKIFFIKIYFLHIKVSAAFCWKLFAFVLYAMTFQFTILSCFKKNLQMDLFSFRNKNGRKTFDVSEKLTSQTWSSFFGQKLWKLWACAGSIENVSNKGFSLSKDDFSAVFCTSTKTFSSCERKKQKHIGILISEKSSLLKTTSEENILSVYLFESLTAVTFDG